MTDIVERLRKGRSANEWVSEELAYEAADEIERLRRACELADRQYAKDKTEIERLRGLVEPDLWDWDIRDKQQKAEIESLRALLQSIQHACHAGINGHNWSITISDADSGQERGNGEVEAGPDEPCIGPPGDA